MNACSGCNKTTCPGRCFDECEADYPSCVWCEEPLDSPGYCERCIAQGAILDVVVENGRAGVWL
jgi:hypothetical protein